MFRTASTENETVIPKTPSRPLNKANTKDVRRAGNYKYRIKELTDPPPPLPGIRSLLPLPGGDLLTGGTGLKIRYWDQARFNITTMYCCFCNNPPPSTTCHIIVFMFDDFEDLSKASVLLVPRRKELETTSVRI